MNWRRRTSRALLVSTFVFTVLAGPLLYVSTVIEEEAAFVAVADRVLAHPEVRAVVAEAATTVTIEVISSDESLTAALPDSVRTFAVPFTQIATAQLTDGAFRLLDSDTAVAALDSAFRELHRQVTADDDALVIDLGAVLVRTSRELGGPAVGAGVAKLMAGSDQGQFTLAEEGSANEGLLTAIRAAPGIGAGVALAGVVSMIGAVVAATDRRRALLLVGLVVAGAAVVSTLAVSVTLFVVLSALSSGSPVGGAVAEVVSADFAQQQRGVVLNGLVLATVALLFGNRPSAVALRSLPSDLWHRRPGVAASFGQVVADNPAGARTAGWSAGMMALVVWSTPTWRVIITIFVLVMAFQGFVWMVTSAGPTAERARSRFGIPGGDGPPMGRVAVNLAFLTAAAFAVWPAWNRPTVLAFGVIFAGLQAAVSLPSAVRAARARSVPVEVAPQVERRGRRYVFAAAALAVAAVIGVVVTDDAVERAEAATGCNGHVELCDRRIDEVVFAGSHNAMSSTELGWDLAMQTGDMVAQLDHGVRALLIDALYWGDTGQLDGGESPAVGPLIEAALSDDRPRAGTWLCHGFCALGATDLTSGLADIDSWLAEHPREVLLIVVQDEISSADLTAAFEASGLRARAHVHQSGTPFPTLGELTERGEQVLVYGENQGEPDSWFQNGWAEAFTETPFTFAVRSDFSCAPNRGDDANPLFLLNHWLTTGIPVREAAIVVNSRDVLLERVRECEVERGRLPTVLAVDFVETGDLVAVVDELNGVGG